jgi:hypothetical protein
MSPRYESWTRRDFLKFAGRAGLLGSFPTLASAGAALEPDTVCISILHTTDLHGHICRHLITMELLTAGDWRVASRRFGAGAGKIGTRS